MEKIETLWRLLRRIDTGSGHGHALGVDILAAVLKPEHGPMPEPTSSTDAALALLKVALPDYEVTISICQNEPVCPTVILQREDAPQHSGMPFEDKPGAVRYDSATLPGTLMGAMLKALILEDCARLSPVSGL